MDTAQDQPIYTITQLNADVKLTLENSFSRVMVIGEISNLVRAASGHHYLTLKDKQAQIRCAFFRGNSRTLTFKPENGQEVLVHARISLYEARGDYQLIITTMELAGDGALQIAFEQQKKKLAKLGLFDPIHKKPLPSYIQTIGVVTSPTGAAIRDIIKVTHRRCPSLRIIIYPSQVQGDTAARQIISAINTANQRQECDVLLVSRGGGSIEDLWCFNDEALAHTIFNSELPIISGVGHEIDFTIADFVADFRAATPSAAAELVSTDINHWMTQIQHLYQRLAKQSSSQLDKLSQQLDSLSKRLRHPAQQLQDYRLRLTHTEQYLTTTINKIIQQKSYESQSMMNHLLRLNPLHLIKTQQQTTQGLLQRLINSANHQVQQYHQHFHSLSQSLNAISPLNTLQRGYAIASLNGKAITDANTVEPEDKLNIKLAKGSINAKVI